VCADPPCPAGRPAWCAHCCPKYRKYVEWHVRIAQWYSRHEKEWGGNMHTASAMSGVVGYNTASRARSKMPSMASRFSLADDSMMNSIS
jgi:hypothetical protein